MQLDSIDRKLLNRLQAEFPLTVEPYAELGLPLGIDGEEVIRRIEQLKVVGIIRQISPVLDARSLDYRTMLVAMRVAENQLDKAAQVIVEHPGVSHAYERDHHFNLWFTLAIPQELKMEMEKFPEINWSAVARKAIKNRIVLLQRFKEFTAESELTDKDALELGRKVNKTVARRYKK